jgi:hypothetical protein
MSTPISIFINSSSAFENTALEIEKALSLKSELISDDDEVKYRYGGLGLTITLFGNHGLEDDKGIPFSHYQYEMDFDVIRISKRKSGKICNIMPLCTRES